MYLQHIGQYADGPHICVKSDHIKVGYFWSGELCGGAGDVNRYARVELTGQTKVNDLNTGAAARLTQDVLRLKVTTFSYYQIQCNIAAH